MRAESSQPQDEHRARRSESTVDEPVREERLSRCVHLLETRLGTPFFPGNRIDVLKNGRQIFPAMLEAMEQAQRSIDLLTFVYWKGDIARRFASLLSRKAQDGVRCRVLLDGYGAFPMDHDLAQQMDNSGVKLTWFRPMRGWWKFWRINHRTHRKVLICDDRIGFTGGVGIAEEWEGDARTEGQWRDTHFRIQGPAVAGLHGGFLGNWAEAVEDEMYDPGSVDPPVLDRAGAAPIQVIRATAGYGWSDIATLQRTLIEMAQERLRIQTAYFVPDRTTLRLLRETVQRGVAVEVLVPGPHHDERVSDLAGDAIYEPLLADGIRIFEFQPSMMHAKVMTVDGRLACIGSANFNQRSMKKDDELSLVVADTALTATLDEHFDEDLTRCRERTLEDHRRRGLQQRIAEWFGRRARNHV